MSFGVLYDCLFFPWGRSPQSLGNNHVKESYFLKIAVSLPSIKMTEEILISVTLKAT